MQAISSASAAQLEVQAQEAARLLKALGNHRRLMVLCQLVSGERSVGELAATVGLSQSALSQHLAKLRQDGLVATRRDSRTIFYRLASEPAARVLQALAAAFCPSDPAC